MELDWETVAGTLKQQNWLNHVEQKSYLGPVGRVKRTTSQSNGFKSGSPKTPTIKSPYLIFMSFTCIYIYKYVCMSMSVYILYIYMLWYTESQPNSEVCKIFCILVPGSVIITRLRNLAGSCEGIVHFYDIWFCQKLSGLKLNWTRKF